MRPRPILWIIFLATGLGVQAAEQPVPSKLTGSKIFLSGAQITRKASLSLTSGSSTLVFTGLPQGLDPQSIEVTGKGGFTILSVNHRVNYLTESPKKQEIADLQDRIKKLEHDYNVERGIQQVWENEEQLLAKNSAVAGQQNGLTATQLQAVNDYVRDRLKAVKIGWLAQQEKLTDIGNAADKLRQQLAQLQAQAPRPTSEIFVEIDAPATVNASFVLTYFTANAGWTPAYDLRARSVDGPVELLMKARIVNNTGEDWDKVDLILNSGNPTLGGVMPMLSPWVLDRPIMLQTIQSAGRTRSNKALEAPAAMAEDALGSSRDLEQEEARFELGNTVVYRTTTFEFGIDAPFSVPSDGIAHTVGVKTLSIPATYRYYAIPKLDKDAFLYARTTGWEDLDLLPGDANVFFEGTYVGRSYLDLGRPQDTLEISLGRDKGVVVERVKRKDYSEKPVIGGKRTVTIAWDLTVKNNKSTAIDLVIKDQMPVSPMSEVEVKLEEDGGAKVDKDKGLLTWERHIAAKGTEKLGFTYSVKHPKDQPVMLE
ncbi:MAG: DUF4139 domain-containing protein [Flavobacteriales bacterium]|nr:DUF4139 domain-containing protein [Flavobacteriales bacterium]MCB9166658.1 DUF4139 domain-containing protein [Flavobacteriales bacterium]